ncbi:MAG: hypothetical protein ACM3SQ_11595 [Betaproteobacteria bacterium]
MARVATALLAAALVALAPRAGRAEADKYDIYAVRFASAGGRPDFFWVLKGADGRIALVDPGYRRARRIDQAHARDFVEPSTAMAPLHVAPSDVTDILLTRVAQREAGAIELFPAARVWVQKTAYDYAVGDAWAEPALHADLDAGAILGLVRRNTAGLLTLVDGDDDASISGIEFHVGRGTGCRCQYLVVQSHGGRFVLAGSRADVMPAMPDVVVEDDPAVFERFTRITDRIVRVE